ncbi:phosphotransferase enzyme family protein [Paenibacillus sp. An7]|uniref:phosphotransferase enzyme family protein n=1 Tax=Paenibacillus sp. An7 TaxID=2689577 RepID=UPI00135BAB49|nr:phosphotransferase [Paenibacillus sp. An7]
MEIEITAAFGHVDIGEVASRYGIKAEALRYIGGFQNFIYECQAENKEYIMRFTPSAHRNQSDVQAELEWILYLAEKGISVSSPVPSTYGRWTETLKLKEMYFTATLFDKAKGKKIDYPDCLKDQELYERLGRVTGRMHALTKSYKPVDPKIRRHDWTDNYYLKNIDILPDSHTGVRERYLELVRSIQKLPMSEDAYGLIHGDINNANYLVGEQGEITLFDFDEAQYSWFVEDIAIQLYYLMYVYGGEEGKKLREDQACRFMEPFLKGYREENQLEDRWLQQMPLFLRLRELIVYIGAFRNFEGDESFSHSDNQWFKDWIRESKIRLETGEPIVNIWG